MNLKGMALVGDLLAHAGTPVSAVHGEKIIGYWCTLVPVEIVTAADMVPYLIQGSINEPPDAVEGVLTRHMCGWIRSCFDAGMKGKYDFLDGLIVPHACNNMDPMHSMWRRYTKVPWVTLLNTPHVVNPATIAFFRGELEDLLKQLERIGGVKVSRAALRQAVKQHNGLRASLRRLSLLKRQHPTNLLGSEMLNVARAARLLPPVHAQELVEQVIEEVNDRTITQRNAMRRVMVYSMDLDSPELIELIEGAGASVVMGYFCPDARSYWRDVPETVDPLDGLVTYYLGTVQCSRLYENALDITSALVKDLCDQFSVEGCIYPVYRYCDTFESDIPSLNEAVTMSGIPGLVLEMDYSMSNSGAMKTRIEAFIENLRNED